MTETLVTVVAEIIAQPGKEAELRAVLMGLIEPTRKEAACVQYDLHERTDKAGHFVFYENWKSQAGLDAHMQTEHLQAALSKVGSLVAGAPSIVTYRRIG